MGRRGYGVAFAVALCTVFLLMGTVSSMLSKIMYQTIAPIDDEGHEIFFKKPWFQVWMMFVGMFFTGPILFTQRLCCKPKDGKKLKPLASGKPLWKVCLMIGVPSTCDLLATMLQNIALLFTNVSIWQMLRGSTCIFAAGQRYLYLGKRIRRHEVLGITFVMIGLVVVGASSIVSPSGTGDAAVEVSTTLKFVGIACVLGAQFVQAFQTVVEEELLHDIESDALFIVFMEGLWGAVLCMVFFMPLAQWLPGKDGEGVHEDVWPEEFYMVWHSVPLMIMSFSYAAIVLLFNVAGMVITEETEATTRNVLDAGRTLLIWICTLLMNLVAPQYGEAVGWFSFIEFFGFVVMMLGMFVYGDVVQLPCFRKEASGAVAGMFASPNSSGGGQPPSPKAPFSPVGARAQHAHGYEATPPAGKEGQNDLQISLVQNEH